MNIFLLNSFCNIFRLIKSFFIYFWYLEWYDEYKDYTFKK